MKVTITTYLGRLDDAGSAVREVKEYASIDELKGDNPTSRIVPSLNCWLCLEEENNAPVFCWLDAFLKGKGFHLIDDTREIKAGESIRVIGQAGERWLHAPQNGIKLMPGSWINLNPGLNFPEGKYFLIFESGAVAKAEYKKPTQDGTPQQLVFLTTSLDC